MTQLEYRQCLDRMQDLSSQSIDLGQQIADLWAEMTADPPHLCAFGRVRIAGETIDVPTRAMRERGRNASNR